MEFLHQPQIHLQYPFFLTDRVLQQTPTSLRAMKNISAAEWCLENQPALPASLLMEIMAQSAGQLDDRLMEDSGFHNRLLARIRRARFYRRIYPGDSIFIDVWLIKYLVQFAAYRVTAEVSGKRVAKCELYFRHA